MAPNFSENKWINQLINICTSILAVLLTVYFASSDLDARELKKEINSKASIEYVDKSMTNHEIKEQIMLNRIENIITLGAEKQQAVLEGQKDYMKSIDKRLERIENKN